MNESAEKLDSRDLGLGELDGESRKLVESVLADHDFREIEAKLKGLLAQANSDKRLLTLSHDFDALFTEWLAYYFLKDQLDENEALTSPKEFEGFIEVAFPYQVYDHVLRSQVQIPYPDGIVFKTEHGKSRPVALCEYTLSDESATPARSKRAQMKAMKEGKFLKRNYPGMNLGLDDLRVYKILPRKKNKKSYLVKPTADNIFKGRMPLTSSRIRSLSREIFDNARPGK